MSKQTKLGSAVESLTNVGIGLGVAIFTQSVIFPWFDISVSLGESFQIASLFTIVSLIRSFIVRRVFNSMGVFQHG